MAIRIRVINGHTVALCARSTVPQEGDLYIDDAGHHALTTKFGVDFNLMGFMPDDTADPIVKEIMLAEEAKCNCPLFKYSPTCKVHTKEFQLMITKNKL